MAKNKDFTLQVTHTFTSDDITGILRGINSFGLEDDDNPITAEEVAGNPELQKYMISELQHTKDEIVEGSYEASANDWLCEIESFRK